MARRNYNIVLYLMILYYTSQQSRSHSYTAAVCTYVKKFTESFLPIKTRHFTSDARSMWSTLGTMFNYHLVTFYESIFSVCLYVIHTKTHPRTRELTIRKETKHHNHILQSLLSSGIRMNKCMKIVYVKL